MLLTGAVPSSPDARDYAFERSEVLAGAILSPDENVDVVDAHTWRVQRANNCVSYTMVEQVQDLATVRGVPLPLLSAAWPYGGARILARQNVPGVGLPDAGSSYRLNLKWGRDRGCVTEEEYPDVPGNITAIPPLAEWEDGGVVKLGACHRVAEGSGMREGLIQALKLAKEGKVSLPGSVMPVDDAYGALAEGDVYRAKGGKPWGFHAQIIGAYDPARDAFAMLSSWGRRVYWVASDWLALNGFEFWIVEDYVVTP